MCCRDISNTTGNSVRSTVAWWSGSPWTAWRRVLRGVGSEHERVTEEIVEYDEKCNVDA